MTPLRRHRLALLAALCVAGAVLLVLLALDARTWQSTMERDDLRFRAIPAHRDLWKPAVLLPADPASALIGTSSTLRWRRAVQYFEYSRLGVDPGLRQDVPTIRANAQDRLQSLIRQAPDPQQRGAAANLLGVLVVTTPAEGGDLNAVEQILARARDYFQEAIAIDPQNADAKENLELVLRLQRPGKGQLGHDARRGFGFGKGRATGPLGSGY